MAIGFVGGGMLGAALVAPGAAPAALWPELAKWLGSMIGVVLGFGLSQAKDGFARKRRMRAMMELIVLELQAAQKSAAGFLNDDVQAPLGRMDVWAFRQHFGALVVDSALTADQLFTIQDAYNKIDAVNRGFDQAAAADAVEDLAAEWRRNRLKTEKFASERYSIAQAIEILRTALRR